MARNRGKLRPTVRDPVAILSEIANDPEAPATARVAAAKALLLAGKTRPPEDPDHVVDDVTRRALEIAAGRAERKLN